MIGLIPGRTAHHRKEMSYLKNIIQSDQLITEANPNLT